MYSPLLFHLILLVDRMGANSLATTFDRWRSKFGTIPMACSILNQPTIMVYHCVGGWGAGMGR